MWDSLFGTSDVSFIWFRLCSTLTVINILGVPFDGPSWCFTSCIQFPDFKLPVGRGPVLSQMQHEPEEYFTSCTAAHEEQAAEWASAVDRRIAIGPEPAASYYVPVG